MTKTLNMACLQTRPMPDVESALHEALELAQEAVANGANFVALPEYCGGLNTVDGKISAPVAEPDTHPFLAGMRAFAAQKAVWVLVGSIAITGPSGKFYNRSFLINDAGDVVAYYNKIHMFDIQLSGDEVYCESDVVEPGHTCVVADTPFGKVGLSICYDLRFARLYRDMAQAGADILFIPAAFIPKTGAAHWHALNRARAIENGAFVVAPCAVGGINGGGGSYGHSLIVSPWGEVLADAGDHKGLAQAEIDLAQVAQTRRRIPSLTHDREFAVSVIKT